MILHFLSRASASLKNTELAWLTLLLVVSTAAGQTPTKSGSSTPEVATIVAPSPLSDDGAMAPEANRPTSPMDDPPLPASPAVEPGSEGGEPPGAGLLKDSLFERWGQEIGHWKSQWPVSVTVGAYHWWHVNNGGPLDSGYGVPSMPGTHSYYLFVDKEQPVDWVAITKIGAHVQMRFRDSGVPLRPFYTDDHFWFWEAYGFLDTPLGRLKMGSIYKQFGLFWDDSWWGNVQYMDGLKLNSAYGLSLEDTPEFKDDFKIDRYFQLFVAEDRVSGAIVGADSESFAGSDERNTFIARVAPTWKLGEKQTFALGLSATVGGIDNQPILRQFGTGRLFDSPGNQTIAGWAVDGTWTIGPWKLFAEVSRLYGTLTPCHYISGGPSNRYTDGLAGIVYTQGPMTYRCVYSYGVYDNPYARQGMFVPAVTAKITSNVTLWFEYTYWNSRAGSSSQDSVLENGYQMIVDWHF